MAGNRRLSVLEKPARLAARFRKGCWAAALVPLLLAGGCEDKVNPYSSGSPGGGARSLRSGNTLLGLYEGVPLTVRTSHYGLAPPDKITIFRGTMALYVAIAAVVHAVALQLAPAAALRGDRAA